MKTKIGIIGGSGLDDPAILEAARDVEIITAWGKPSAALKVGKIASVEVALLARHGREHTIPPSEVNYRANIRALADFGCTHVVATTAVGSLREEIGRGDLVILDQFIDFTKRRASTYTEAFEPHTPVHPAMADPFDEGLRRILARICSEKGYAFHPKGTLVTIEGPRFSTRAESRMFRSWGADVINMSVATEASLANEIGLAYAAIAMSTDYDCWKVDEEPVSWEAVLAVFKANAEKVTELLVEAIPRIAAEAESR
ncbi:MAG TPA: S-methyl-5'-thioadenosine phosphorylase [Rectinemataceae bacterium]|nr:S-methyl-5'-thioadenosine phosphorylase [Rectinemataceae bacterium]